MIDCNAAAVHRTAIMELCRRKHERFMRHTWRLSDPFIAGTHTKAICERIDRAIVDFRNGKSTYCVVLVPFRHGKSDMLSRYLPPRFLGEFPDSELICASYSAEKAEEFSRFARNIMRTEEYRSIYPNVTLSDESQSVSEWGVSVNGKWRNGKAQFMGLQGSATGKGAACMLIDDYCKGPEEANSESWRNKTWEVFNQAFFTRRAPVSIVFICVTPWHTDDLVGRIQREQDTNPMFPKFEFMRFPAFDPSYPTGTLFPERFNQSWYEESRAALGEYGTAALMQCNPTIRGGRLLKTDRIVYVEPSQWETITRGLRFVRAWDLASSQDSGDSTSGTKMAGRMTRAQSGAVTYNLFIDDVTHGRWEALQRNNIIQDTALNDGSISVGIEAFGAYKDAYTQIRDALKGVRNVLAIRLPGDKEAKAGAVIPLFEAGKVYVKKAPWNAEVVKQWSEFPGGKHDDHVDSLTVGASMIMNSNTSGMTNLIYA